MAMDFDPIGAGFVASLAQPDGNITGLTDMTQHLTAKRLQFLQEAVVGVSRIAVLWNPTHVNAALSMRESEEAARGLGAQASPSRGYGMISRGRFAWPCRSAPRPSSCCPIPSPLYTTDR